jgi:hypothetical protein
LGTSETVANFAKPNSFKMGTYTKFAMCIQLLEKPSQIRSNGATYGFNGLKVIVAGSKASDTCAKYVQPQNVRIIDLCKGLMFVHI